MSDNDDFKEVPRQLRGIDLAHKQKLSPLRPLPAIRVLKTSLILGATRRKYPTKVRQRAAIQNQERAAMRLQEALITTGGKGL